MTSKVLDSCNDTRTSFGVTVGMMTPEIREELKRIQAELKKVFPVNRHEVRDLPGGQRKWVYLKWQTIRERLDEVCPDWIVDYSEIQYLGNDAICRCGISILGVRKEAIASVPISILSSKGNEMTRGSAADRLAAEAIKNSGEAWGVGRYLDDQQFTIRYLWEHMGELDEQMQGEVRRLSEQYKIQVSGRQPQVNLKVETGFIHAVAGISFNFKLYALCIMSNHVHYLLEPEQPEDLPKIMHWLNWYTQVRDAKL